MSLLCQRQALPRLCAKNKSALRNAFRPTLSSGNCARRISTCCQAALPPPVDEDFEGLSPDEDEEVPGTYADAMNPNTKLGRAIKRATEEIQTLSGLERESLQQCQDLLAKLGYKGNILKQQASNGQPDSPPADMSTGTSLPPQ